MGVPQNSLELPFKNGWFEGTPVLRRGNVRWFSRCVMFTREASLCFSGMCRDLHGSWLGLGSFTSYGGYPLIQVIEWPWLSVEIHGGSIPCPQLRDVTQDRPLLKHSIPEMLDQMFRCARINDEWRCSTFRKPGIGGVQGRLLMLGESIW